jgi:hypothetical protein
MNRSVMVRVVHTTVIDRSGSDAGEMTYVT